MVLHATEIEITNSESFGADTIIHVLYILVSAMVIAYILVTCKELQAVGKIMAIDRLCRLIDYVD